MKALLCTELGSFDHLQVTDVPAPKPGARQVKSAVKAASLNFPDVLQVQGLYQVKPDLPFIPGMEFAGIVTEVGREVTEFKVGDRITAIGQGGFAEEAISDIERTLLLPANMSFESAAGLLLTYGTSLRALVNCGHLKAGETLLVLGASGGVGTAAIEIGRVLGARIIAAASSDEKLEVCRKLGAEGLINYSKENLRDRLKELTGGRGIDVVYDPVGGPYTEPALRALAWGGRLLVIGFAAGDIPKIPINLCLLNERSIVGVYWGGSQKAVPESYQQNVRTVLEWAAAGKLNPQISERVSLRQAPALMARMANRQVVGKAIVLPTA